MPARVRLVKAAHGKYGTLLLALLALIITAPVVNESQAWRIVLSFIAACVIVAGLVAARPGRGTLVLGLILAASDFGIGELAAYDTSAWLLRLQALLWLLTLTFVSVTILEAVLESQPVTLETLQAAFCVFLLIGLAWGYAYILIELLAPGSFQLRGGDYPGWAHHSLRRASFLRFLILSYSAITSRGYGELTPASDFANIAVCLESMGAQVYLAVVIARLVGLQASRVNSDNDAVSGRE
ncbi:MAG TPA: hypothetical protein VJY33_09455 [Isosphaeraceae bacterium]|nr:hypothetical protein [Isosphaeraceae bacterium]